MVRQHQTSDAQLRIGESRDSGFDALHRPGMTATAPSRNRQGGSRCTARFRASVVFKSFTLFATFPL
jgi:hypothetical protein